MNNGTIFPRLREEAIREEVLQALLTIPGRILTLWLFVQDTKWLEPVSLVLKSLLPPRFKGSLRHELHHWFDPSKIARGIPLQKTEHSSETRILDPQVAWSAAYLQVVLFAWRDFPALTGIMPRKDIGKAKPKPAAAGEDHWFRIARFSSSVGIENQQIRDMQRVGPDEKLIRKFLDEARPSRYFHVDQEKYMELLNSIETMLESLAVSKRMEAVVQYTTNGSAVPMDHRCGRPFENDWTHDRFFIFILIF